MRDRLLEALAVSLVLSAAPVHAQLAPPGTGGVGQFDALLAQLSENRRVLAIGAHPDDEDSDLLAFSARGIGARTGYLSLTRGEGGQNLIGTELGDALGLLRTAELVAARSIDGAEQFFSRAYDFGFTVSLDETFSFWHPDSVLKDVVRVVRRFQPDILVAFFSGTPRDGHGQHQASAVVARRAFTAAADPNRFPELATEEGLQPWQPRAFYMSTRSRTRVATVALPSGSTEPVSGKSFHQIAMEGRSQHRSQDMGRLQQTGPRSTGLLLLDSAPGFDRSEGSGMFVGVAPRPDWLSALADSLRISTGPAGISSAVPRLATAVERAHSDPGIESRRTVLLERAMLTAANIVLDATASRAKVVAGGRFEVTVEVYNDGSFPVEVRDLTVSMPAGWTATRRGTAVESVSPGSSAAATFDVEVAAGAETTQPYFLRTDRNGFLYDWSGVPPEVRGEPLQPPALNAVARLALLGATPEMRREVSFRFNDQAIGEIRSEVRVVPRLDVTLSPAMVVWPVGAGGAPSFTVAITNNDSTAVSGTLELQSGGTRVGESRRFEFTGAGESEAFILTVPAPDEEGELTVDAVAAVDGGARFRNGVREIAYGHIRPDREVVPARALVRVASLRLPELNRVGYVRGAADLVPEALAGIGFPVEVLSDEQIEQGDLERYDAIVIGSRAYETNPALGRHNDRFLAYARRGGRLIVQYQQYQFVTGGYAAYPLTIASPHDRITDENAPVELIEPGNPAFVFPNPITETDWEGWPQERGLYFAHEWAPEYRPLLRMSDPGGPPLDGGLLVARYGEGTYVYTGISFFRALPAGVPGAFRLFLNLLGIRAGATP